MSARPSVLLLANGTTNDHAPYRSMRDDRNRARCRTKDCKWAAIAENRTPQKAIAPTPVNAIRNQCGEGLWLNGGTPVPIRGWAATGG
jgi:hypothetical protein